jgi:hypothetical protein
MKRGLIKNFLALLILLGLVSACNLSYFEDAELGDFVWDPSLAVPIGEITYSIDDLFEELNDTGAEIGPNDENIITVSYRETLQSQTAESFLSILDQNFSGSLDAGVDVVNPGVSTTVTVSRTFEYDISQRNQEEYDSILFSSGQFDITLTSELDADLDFRMRIFSLENKATDNPMTFTGSLTPATPVFTGTRSLANFDGSFHFDADGDPVSNKVVFELEYDITVEPGSSVSSTDGVSFDVLLSNAQFEQVYGDVGTQALNVNFEVVNLDFFKDFDAGGIRFSEPSLNFVFDNGFGFPLGIDFQNISAIASDGAIIPLSGSATAAPTIVEAPDVEDIGTIETTDFVLNSTNSNIADLLEIQPNKVIMEIRAETNPAGAPDQYNFVDINSLLDVSVQVDLPLIANIDDLVAEETVDFNNGTDLEEAKSVMLRVITENELPLGGEIELQFLDASNNIVFTVSERPVFTAAPIASGDRTTEVAVTTVDVQFTESDIRAIENATRINVMVRLATTDASSGNAVKFFSDYELKIKLAAQADIQVGTN